LTIDDVEIVEQDMMKVMINDSKNGKRWFVLPRSDSVWDMYPVYKELMGKRDKVKSNRLFLKLSKSGAMMNTPVGINTISGYPKRIAERLKLENPNRYTGHTFRRTGTTLLAQGGIDAVRLMRYGKWKDIGCAEGYIADSMKEKVGIANMIIGNSESVQQPIVQQQQQNVQQYRIVQSGAQQVNYQQLCQNQHSVDQGNAEQNNQQATIQKFITIYC